MEYSRSQLKECACLFMLLMYRTRVFLYATSILSIVSQIRHFFIDTPRYYCPFIAVEHTGTGMHFMLAGLPLNHILSIALHLTKSIIPTYFTSTPLVQSEREGDFIPTRFQEFTCVVKDTPFAGHLLNATMYSHSNLRRIISQRHNNNNSNSNNSSLPLPLPVSSSSLSAISPIDSIDGTAFEIASFSAPNTTATATASLSRFHFHHHRIASFSTPDTTVTATATAIAIAIATAIATATATIHRFHFCFRFHDHVRQHYQFYWSNWEHGTAYGIAFFYAPDTTASSSSSGLSI